MTVALVCVAVSVGMFFVFAFATEHRPAPREAAPVSCAGGPPSPAPTIRTGRPFRVVSWNVQFGAGRKHHFFYDGGDAVHVPRKDTEDAVTAIQVALRDAAPDIALFQEVDRDADRTHRIDQLPLWIGAAGMGSDCHVSATYHRSPFVPHPLPAPLGRVDLHLAIAARGPLAAGERQALPQLDESRLRRVFNLKRALLTAEAPIDGHPLPLRIAVTHLSAFSYGDGTLARQVEVVEAWMDAQSKDPAQPWILAGDFNMLPPGDDPGRLSKEGDLYREERNPIEALIPRFRTVFPVADLLNESARTYTPFGRDAPDRKIDYVFIGGPIEVVGARADRAHVDLSDHLPLVAELRIVTRD